MPKFAVYYIPKADSPFYRLGSSILGYDIRTETQVTSPPPGISLPMIDPGWRLEAMPYGFHLTIGDAIDFLTGDLYCIVSEIEGILQCFAPRSPFILRQCSPLIPNWGDPIAIRYDADDNLKLLHTLVVSRVNTLGIGSGYLDRYLKEPSQYSATDAQCILRFYSRFILSNFNPHFTLLNPYRGTDRTAIVSSFTALFHSFDPLQVESICLVVQLSGGANWKIYKEFKLP
jgi:hypothetical protein